ncbi:MAG: methanethiol S-methyltransferase [Crocosphaera sp.]
MQQEQTVNSNFLSKISVLTYGIICYLISSATLVYAVGFLSNMGVSNSLDSPTQGTLLTALLVDGTLLGVFALQHSVMARQSFKAWWTKLIPQPLERSTYVLLSSLALILLFWQWQPIGIPLWIIDNLVAKIVLYSLFALGWIIVSFSTFLINHFDLFGIRQVYLYFQGKEYTHLPFKTPVLYNYVRHPLYVGWLLVVWMTPTITVAHFFLALMTTIYILIAIQLEEKDLVDIHGEKYQAYRREVPMLIPFWPTKS